MAVTEETHCVIPYCLKNFLIENKAVLNRNPPCHITSAGYINSIIAFPVYYPVYMIGVFNPIYPLNAVKKAIIAAFTKKAPASLPPCKAAASFRKMIYRIIFQIRIPTKTMLRTMLHSTLFQNT